jgi:3-oxoacyl-[acyl-carrier-protein] synthase III
VIRSYIIGCGAYLPKNIVTNHQLAARMDTSDEWIKSRTGITERHIGWCRQNSI